MAKKILGGIGGGLGTLGLVGSLLGGKKKRAAAIETPLSAPVAPVVDDAKILQARKRSIIQQRQRGGRASTLLSGDKMGG